MAMATPAPSTTITDVASPSFDSDMGRALAACGTSNSWSTLEAVAKKVGKRMGQAVTPRELDDFMEGVGDSALQQHGVWRTSFGKKYMSIVLVNVAFGRALAARGATSAPPTCSCGATPSSSSGSDKQGDAASRYFGSHDYNAGRHSTTNSIHKASCLLWRPPTTSHLHSWRRGFASKGTKK